MTSNVVRSNYSLERKYLLILSSCAVTRSMTERSKTEEVHLQSSTLSQRSSHDDSKLTFDSDDLTEIFVKHLFDQDLG